MAATARSVNSRSVGFTAVTTQTTRPAVGQRSVCCEPRRTGPCKDLPLLRRVVTFNDQQTAPAHQGPHRPRTRQPGLVDAARNTRPRTPPPHRRANTAEYAGNEYEALPVVCIFALALCRSGFHCARNCRWLDQRHFLAQGVRRRRGPESGVNRWAEVPASVGDVTRHYNRKPRRQNVHEQPADPTERDAGVSLQPRHMI
jgi:hypothetical protein